MKFNFTLSDFCLLRKFILFSFLMLLLISPIGCKTLSNSDKSKSKVTEVSKEVEERADELGIKKNLTLDDCIALALKNNASIKSAEIEKKIAKLDKNIAFSNFLPQITASYQWVSYDRQPMISIFGPFPTAMQDKVIRMADLQFQMPIFAPATWFIYDLRKKGVDISTIVYDYTCQMIALQTTLLYFQVILLENMEKSLQTQLKSALELKNQVQSFYEEGLLTQSQLEKVSLLVQLKERDLNQCRYEISLAKGKLNSVIGIMPTENIELEFQGNIPLPEGSVEDWIIECLNNHPQVKIVEKKVEIAEGQIKLAISQFLPLVGIFTQWQYTSNSFNYYSQSVMNGLSALLTVFNGFENIEEYKKARLSKEKAYIEMENTVLLLIVGIISAKTNFDKAIEDIKLAEKNLSYQREQFREMQEKWNEEVVTDVDLVSARANLDTAEINYLNAEIQEQIARAIIWNAIGKTYKGKSFHLITQDAVEVR